MFSPSLSLSLLATGRQKEKTEVEGSLKSAIPRPTTVHHGVKATESQKESMILGQKKMNVVLSPKTA